MSTNDQQLSFHDYRMRTGRGGPRPGAGRPRSGSRRDPKQAREQFGRLTPAHITLRVGEDIPPLRCGPLIRGLRESFRQACERDDFRLVHYSVQDEHLHLIVEAEDSNALGRGMMSISSRVAHVVKRAFGIKGSVLDGPYHCRLLRSPKEVWRALRYVLLNVRKHWKQRNGKAPPLRLDEASSGRWFDGWKSCWNTVARQAREGPPEVAAPHTWLLAVGWRRSGLVDLCEVPGG